MTTAAPARRAARGRRRVTLTSTAPRLSSSCSSVRGPMIGAVMPGCARIPRERELRRRAALLLRERDEPLDDVVRGRRRGAAEVVLAALPTARGALVVALVLAGQQAAAQRRPRDQREPERLRRRNHLALGRAVEQVVRHLLADEAVEPELLRRPQRLDALPRRKHARADVAHLALRESGRRARAASRRSECRIASDAADTDRSNPSAGASATPRTPRSDADGSSRARSGPSDPAERTPSSRARRTRAGRPAAPYRRSARSRRPNTRSPCRRS